MHPLNPYEKQGSPGVAICFQAMHAGEAPWASLSCKQLAVQGAGGCLHSREDTYKALKLMVASLGDRYTEFLGPTQAGQLPKSLFQQHALETTIARRRSGTGCPDDAGCAVSCQFRQALRRPQPAERDYLEAQATGIGLQLGLHARLPPSHRDAPVGPHMCPLNACIEPALLCPPGRAAGRWMALWQSRPLRRQGSCRGTASPR